MLPPIPEALKAYVALAGAIATALLGVFAAATPVGQVLTAIVAVATGVATYYAKNAEKVDDANTEPKGFTDPGPAECCGGCC